MIPSPNHKGQNISTLVKTPGSGAGHVLRSPILGSYLFGTSSLNHSLLKVYVSFLMLPVEKERGRKVEIGNQVRIARLA